MDLLPGGARGVFKVVVSDGFHTTEAVSLSSLRGDDKPPVASILQPASPADGQIQPLLAVQPGRITFEAHGSDLEDGVLGDDSFLWFHGADRTSLGRGKRIPAHLPDGLHEITLVVFDSAGNSAEKTIVLRVGQGQSDT